MDRNEGRRLHVVSFEVNVSCQDATPKHTLWVQVRPETPAKDSVVTYMNFTTTDDAYPTWFTLCPISLAPKAEFFFGLSSSCGILDRETQMHVFMPGSRQDDQPLTLVVDFNTPKQDKCMTTLQRRTEHIQTLTSILNQPYDPRNFGAHFAHARLAGVDPWSLRPLHRRAQEEALHYLEVAMHGNKFFELSMAVRRYTEIGLSGDIIADANHQCTVLHQKIKMRWVNLDLARKRDDIFAVEENMVHLQHLGCSPANLQHAKDVLRRMKAVVSLKDAQKYCDEAKLKEAIWNADEVGVEKVHIKEANESLEKMQTMKRIEIAAFKKDVPKLEIEYQKAEINGDLMAMREASKQLTSLETQAKEQQYKDAVASISKGVETNDFHMLANAIDIAKNIDFDVTSLNAATQALQYIAKQALENACGTLEWDTLTDAIKMAGRAGLEEKHISRAKECLQQIDDAARDALHSRNAKDSRASAHAILYAEKINLDEKYLDNATRDRTTLDKQAVAERKCYHAMFSATDEDLTNAQKLSQEAHLEKHICKLVTQALEQRQRRSIDKTVAKIVADYTGQPSEMLPDAEGTQQKTLAGKLDSLQVSSVLRSEHSCTSESSTLEISKKCPQGAVNSTTLHEFTLRTSLEQAEGTETSSREATSRAASTDQSNEHNQLEDAPKNLDLQATTTDIAQAGNVSIGTTFKAHNNRESINEQAKIHVQNQDHQEESCDQELFVPMKVGTEQHATNISPRQISKNDITNVAKGSASIPGVDRRSTVSEVESFDDTTPVQSSMAELGGIDSSEPEKSASDVLLQQTTCPQDAKPRSQYGMGPGNRSNWASTCSHKYQCNKAHPTCQWEVHSDCDLCQSGAVEVMSASDVTIVRKRVAEMGYSGFCEFGGMAYIKKFAKQLERKDLSFRGLGSGCVFHIAVQQVSKPYVLCTTTATDPGYVVHWQHRDETGQWQDFASDIFTLVEKAYCLGSSKVSFYIGFTPYEVDFCQMKQTNITNYKRTRHVRRHFFPPHEVTFMWHPAVIDMGAESTDRAFGIMKWGNDVHSNLERLTKKYINQLKRSACTKVLVFEVPAWRGIDADSWLVVAAVSVAIFTVMPRIRPTIKFMYREKDQDFRISMQKLQRDLKATQYCYKGLNLPQRNGVYTWLRHAKDTESRWCRLASACSVLRLYSCPSFSTTRTPSCIDSMIKQTQLVDYDGLRFDLLPECRYQETEIVFSNKPTLLEAALQVECDPRSVAVVNAASGYHVGGGFLTGGRHALEEALCMQSTLYFSLARADELASKERDGRGLVDYKGRPIHIPEHGCLLSPDVEVTREGTDNGYACRPSIIRFAAVLSIAMPNKNVNVVDSPVDYRDGKDYEELVRRKFISAMVGAIRVGATVLVVPDCGCGVFQNKPVRVGHLLKEVLEKFNGHFEKVILVGSSKFAEAVGAVKYESESVFSSFVQLWSTSGS